jgi:hypothetical protein
MILKRYGRSYESVDPNFESKALNEIGFRRGRDLSVTAEEFEARYELETRQELRASAEGPVQDHTEQLLLDRLETQLFELEAGLEPGCVLVVESESGVDYPKTRQSMRNIVEGGENRLHFSYTVEPPLRVGIYRERARV